MFALPSMWNLVISTVVFFVGAWYIHRYLENQDIPKGMTRSILVFVLASVASWGAGTASDWVQLKVSGPSPSATAGISQLLQDQLGTLEASPNAPSDSYQ
ncbi:MAG: hypothetical protein R8K20_11420 [Gallionellaceae bacterium]